MALLVSLYYGVAHIGYAFEFAGPVAAIVWLPVGVGIAFLYLAGLRFWPAVVVGDLLVNNYSALPLGSALGQTIGNLLEVVLTALLLRRLSAGRSLSSDVGGVWRMLLAIAAGTAISATIGTLSLRAGSVISASALPRVWRTWWLGDFSGALLVVPLAVAWWRPADPEERRWRSVDVVVGLTAVIALSELAWRTTMPLTYVVFPALIWTAFRLGPRWATLAVLIAAGFAVWATTMHVGPFRAHSFDNAVIGTQLFIAVASLSSQCVAAVVDERRRFARDLWESRARLLRAADTERLRLERNLHDGAQQRLAEVMVRLELATDAGPDPAHIEAAVRTAQTELVAAVDELRDLAHGKHPRALTERGFTAAILDMAKRSAIPIEVGTLPQRRLPELVEATAYYVVAEAVTNAQRYARPSAIRVGATLSRHALSVRVEDDGVGGAAESSGSGLEGLRDRLDALGGRLEIHSARERGTRIDAEIPVPD